MAKKERSKASKKISGLWAEFKKFISRGNVVDMAVGVVIGGAFSAIVTALVNILLSVCTWGVPGGLSSLITVLPAANAAQAGYDTTIGLGQTFGKGELQTLAETLAEKTYDAATIAENPSLIETAKSTILSNYTLRGMDYVYNQSSVIDWGTFINAIISFLIIALTLFIILKVYNYLRAKKAEMDAKLLEEYYEKHPEERPVPPEEAPKQPTEVELLIEIRDALVKKEESK